MSTEFQGLCSRIDMLSEQHLMFLAERSDSRLLKKGEQLYDVDDHGDFIYVVKSGTVKVGTVSSSGREIIKAVLFADMIFGECAVLGCDRDSYAVAMESDTRVLAIDSNAVRDVMAANFDFCLFVMSEIRAKLAYAEQRMEALVAADARGRIVDFIKYNAAKSGRSIGFETLVKHSLTQQDIANYTGTSRQTVTSVFNELRDDNLIYFKRKSILIRDIETLA